MADSTISVSFVTTTLLGSHLGLSNLLPVPYDELSECTLNTHLSVATSESIGSALPKLRYFGVGIAGGYNADDTILFSCYNPSRQNMNLYSLIPIRCVPVDEDLSDSERALYRLRVRKTFNGTQYFLYYLKCLTFAEGISFKRISTDYTTSVISLDPTNLSPTPVKSSTNATAATAESVIASCDAQMALSSDEILEYINVAYNGDTRYARISEVGFFAGVDKAIPATTGAGNTAISLTESLNTKLCVHCTLGGMTMSTPGINFNTTVSFTSKGVQVKA